MRRNREERRQYIFAMKQLVSREVKRKYARSYLGVVWSVLNPLMSMAVLSMIFSTMFRRSIANFPIYYLTGNLFWQLFSESTNSAMTALVDNRGMLLKVKLTKQTFVLARVFTALVNFGYSCVAYVLMLLLFHIRPNQYMLLFPIAVFFALLFSLGIGYILAILYVFFGDIKYLYSVILTLWMYLSAVFYPVDGLNATMQRVIEANPIYSFILFARDLVLYGTVPTPAVWIRMSLWGIGSFAAGYWIFRKNQNRVMQKI